jgi:pimeloyl-ACP methyl ester carboxylesterase
VTHVLRIGALGSLGMLMRRGAATDPGLPPVLLLHGATLGAPIFDLPLPGYSLLEELAKTGRTAYALDIRGFGHSMERAALAGSPDRTVRFPTLSEAVSDIGTAVDDILQREDTGTLDMVGFSWGSITSACYAAANPGKIARLVLCAPLYGEVNPLWLERIAEAHGHASRSGIGAYRFMTRAELVRRWDADLGAGEEPAQYRERGVAEALFQAFAGLQPGTEWEGQPAFRYPAGPLTDLLCVFSGRPVYDPAGLTMPTLLVRSDGDTTSTDVDARKLLQAIASPRKSYRVIDAGSHFMLLEKNRGRVYTALIDYLGPLR